MRRAVALLVFFLSGFAALLYQVVWQRLLVFFSGADFYSVTIIVAAFMAGLGIGNLAGGHLADRASRRRTLGMFVAAECAIALFGFFSKAFFYDFLYQQHHALGRSTPLLSTVLLLALLWPTFFMGVSLPLLARALTSRVRTAAPTIGRLYGVNTLGAAMGSLVTTWALLPRFGLEKSLNIGVALNVLCAVLLVLVLWKEPARETAGDASTDVVSAVAGAPQRFAFGVWLLLFGLSGFIALSLEILWFRLLGVMLKSTSFTFGTLLAVYLAGIALGALVGATLVQRSRRPVVGFLALQTIAALCAALTLAGFFFVLTKGGFPELFAYFAGGEPLDIGAVFGAIDAKAGKPGQQFAMLYIFLPLAIVGPTTFLMGLSFPYLQKAVQADALKIGRRVGLLQFSNIIGSMAGAMLTGLLFFSLFETALTLKIVLAFAAVFAALWWWTVVRDGSLRGVAFLPGLALIALMFGILPDGNRLWATLHGTKPDAIVFKEDGSGMALVRIAGEGGVNSVFVNGLSQSWIPYGGIHTVLGALPVLIHPNPRDVAVIGLGSGDTVFSVGGRSETENVTCIEIVKPQLETLRAFNVRNFDYGLDMLLRDSRIKHETGDGRALIMRSDKRYDVIEADALRPSSAYAGNLYSREYFQLLRAHLKPGGLAVTWAPTRRIHDTFLSVFPFVLRFDQIAIGSSDPIEFEPSTVLSRARDFSVQRYYRRAGLDIDALVLDHTPPGASKLYGPQDSRADAGAVNTDLFPRDEFDLPALSPQR